MFKTNFNINAFDKLEIIQSFRPNTIVNTIAALEPSSTRTQKNFVSY